MIPKSIPSRISYLAGLLCVLLALSYLSHRHYVRFDLTENRLYSLSPKSIAVASDLKTPVDIFVYFKPEHELARMLKNLLISFEACSDNIIVHWIDPYRDFESMNLLGKLGEEFRPNTVLLRTPKRHRFLGPAELGIYDRELEKYGVAPRLLAFNGEAAVAGALVALADSRTPTIGLIGNHGERLPAKNAEDGISLFVRNRVLEGYRVTLLDLKKITAIPAEITILASCRPRVDFSDEELDLLHGWIRKGGSFFLAVDPLISSRDGNMMTFNLNPLLEKRGIVLENTIVVDPSRQLPYSRPDYLLIDSYSQFEIVQNMNNIPVLFFQARSLAERPGADCRTAPLLATTKNGWGETDFADPNYVFNADKDEKGPNVIAMASWEKSGVGKCVVVGDSDFMSDRQLRNPGNARLLENCFYWLSDKTRLLEIPPRKTVSFRLALNRGELLRIFSLGAVLPPALVLLAGLIVCRARR